MRAKATQVTERGESEDSRGRQRFLIEHLMKVNGRLCVRQGIGKRELIIV